jgi:hypothetical protein
MGGPDIARLQRLQIEDRLAPECLLQRLNAIKKIHRLPCADIIDNMRRRPGRRQGCSVL